MAQAPLWTVILSGNLGAPAERPSGCAGTVPGKRTLRQWLAWPVRRTNSAGPAANTRLPGMVMACCPNRPASGLGFPPRSDWCQGQPNLVLAVFRCATVLRAPSCTAVPGNPSTRGFFAEAAGDLPVCCLGDLLARHTRLSGKSVRSCGPALPWVLCSKVGRDGSSRWPGRRDYRRHERHRRAHRGAVRRRKATTVIVGRQAAQGDAHAAKLGPKAEFVRADVSVKRTWRR